MKKIGIFYSANAIKTRDIAKKIVAAFKDSDIETIAIEEASQKDFEKYDNIIAGISTWFDGEIPMYWDEVIPEIESAKLKGKKIAVFGLGDQVGYPDNFADGIGILANIFLTSGAILVGKTSVEGYNFEKSQAQESDKFLGLIIDIENQADKTEQRINQWVKQLKIDFNN